MTSGDPQHTAGPLAVEVSGVSKTYGGIHALAGVDVTIPGGTVEALVGQNGAGKSTLVGILSGRVAPSAGTVRVLGTEPAPGEPRAARAAGLFTIYQELTTVPGLSAEENVFLGMAPSAGGMVKRSAMRSRYLEFCERMGISIPPRSLAGRLSVADNQIIEIMRALVADAKVLLLDEPTAALAAAERDALLRLIRDLRRQGVTIIYISHNLNEVLEIADHLTVLRDGKVAAEGPAAEWDESRLVGAMLGGKADHLAARMLDRRGGQELAGAGEAEGAPAAKRRPQGTSILEARGITLEGAIENIDLTVREGEILGLGGLVGSGRSTVMRCLAGAEPGSIGTLTLNGEQIGWPHSVRRAMRRGIVMIPEDRKGAGLVLSMKALDNIALPDLGASAQFGWLSDRRTSNRISDFAHEFGFDAARLGTPAGNLSGGNQQKLMLARWRYRSPVVLLADEPTRGIDVGAKEEVLDSLRRFADSGIGVVVASSELEEISLIADRVLVLSEGQAVAELQRTGGRIPVDDILAAIYGGGTPDHETDPTEGRSRATL